MSVGTCRVCGCTEAKLRRRDDQTGEPFWWVQAGLCSFCEENAALQEVRDLMASGDAAAARRRLTRFATERARKRSQ